MHARPLAAALALALAVAVAGCASHDDAHAHPIAPSDAGADAALAPALEDPSIAAPTVSRAMPMGDGVHVTWTNPAARCEAVRGERATEGGPWASAFRVDGALDNLHDGGLVKNALYTYRLRCEIGGRVSPPSNEKSAYY
jgi:hypothetical protein